MYIRYVYICKQTQRGEELVVMPYPIYGNQCMAVNDGEGARFTCFTSTKVQMLTPDGLDNCAYMGMICKLTYAGTDNCAYMGVTYKGFPYIFLVATKDIREGEELLTRRVYALPDLYLTYTLAMGPTACRTADVC